MSDSELSRSVWIKALTWLFEFATQISSPFNVQHHTHVDRNFTWTMMSPDDGHGGGGQSPSMATLENEFKFTRCLGKGSFGRVYKATHLAANSVVAIKVCKVNPFNSDLDTVKKEVNMLKTVRHPNIVDFFGCWGPDKRDRLWILTEYCALGSITDVRLTLITLITATTVTSRANNSRATNSNHLGAAQDAAVANISLCRCCTRRK